MTKLRIYVASIWSSQPDVRRVCEHLVALGAEVTARWPWMPPSTDLAAGAELDLHDLDAADAVLFRSLSAGQSFTGGGRWFEFGYAYAKGKICVAHLPNGHETVFSALPSVLRIHGPRTHEDVASDALRLIRGAMERRKGASS